MGKFKAGDKVIHKRSKKMYKVEWCNSSLCDVSNWNGNFYYGKTENFELADVKQPEQQEMFTDKVPELKQEPNESMKEIKELLKEILKKLNEFPKYSVPTYPFYPQKNNDPWQWDPYQPIIICSNCS